MIQKSPVEGYSVDNFRKEIDTASHIARYIIDYPTYKYVSGWYPMENEESLNQIQKNLTRQTKIKGLVKLNKIPEQYGDW